MARRALIVLSAVFLAACGGSDPAPRQVAEVVPAVIVTSTAPTTTTTAPEPEPAPVTTSAPVRPATTVPAAPRPTTTVARASAAPTASTGSGACGGDLPPCYVMDRESGGDPTAVGYGQCGTAANPRNCQGKWQIDPDTAESVGYPRNLADQPESVQDDAARAIKARDGCSAWSTC